MASLIQTLFYLFAFAALVSGCSPAQPVAPRSMPAMQVVLAPATEKVLDDTSTYVATLKSRKSLNLRPQASGRILEIFVRSGEQVPQGAPIAELDKHKQEALVSSCEAAIQSAMAEKRNAEATLKTLAANRLSKVANVEFQRRQFSRYKQLNTEGAVSAENVDQVRNQLAVAEAEVEAVDAQLSAQHASVAKNDRLIEQARSQLLEQQEQLKYFTVRSPFAGIVGDIPVKLGDQVDTTSVLTTIDQSRPLELYVSVPTSQFQRLRKGLVVQILSADGKVSEEGRVFFISSQVDGKDQSILAKAELQNPANKLRSGQVVNARVIWDKVHVVTIPVTAVTRFSGQDFVYLAVESEPGKIHAKQTLVKLGDIEGNEYRVVSGLKPGDKIVASGGQNLSDGMPIQPKM